MDKKVAIIGAGPAGISCAVQLSRFGIKAILFDNNESSLLRNAWRVENYPGIYPGISGIKLLKKFYTTLKRANIRLHEKVELLDYDATSRLFKIKTIKKLYFVDYVVVASGTKPKRLKSSIFSKSTQSLEPYLFYDIFPLLRKRNKNIAIIGGGDAAFDNALSLAVKKNNVIICSRCSKSAILPLLKSVQKLRNIIHYCNYEIKYILPGKENNLILGFIDHCYKKIKISADYVVGAIGRVPQKDFYTNNLKSIEKKLIKSNRLFLVGDVKNDKCRQVAIAVGDGCLAAMHIFLTLKTK